MSLPSCLALDATSICGFEYNGYPILKSVFAGQANLDTFISGSVMVSAGINEENSTSVTSAFISTYGCSGAALNTDISMRRFHASYYCSVVVQDAITQGCTFDTKTYPAAGPILCSSSCNLATSTLQAIFADTSACPVSSVFQTTRDQLVTKFQSFCTNATIAAAKQNGLCVKGATAEQGNCGFTSIANAQIGCASFSNDACCKSLLANAVAGNGTAKIQSNKAAGTSSNSTALIAGIVGSLVFLLLCASVVYFYQRRKRNADKFGHANSTIGGQKDQDYFKHSPLASVDSARHSFQSASNARKVDLYEPTHQQPLATLTQPLEARQEEPYSMTNYAASDQEVPPLPSLLFMKNVVAPASPKLNDTKTMKVVHPYYPTLQDELRLEVGSDLILVKSFDDGWALGLIPSTGQQGAFPLVCVANIDSPPIPCESRRSTLIDEHMKFKKRESSQAYGKPAANSTVSQFYGDLYEEE